LQIKITIAPGKAIPGASLISAKIYKTKISNPMDISENS
jgi:hypothetical protein